MSKIAIVTDSTAAFPSAVLGEVPVVSVPLDVVWGSRTLRDGIDISPAAFYDEIKTATVMPTTSQPSPSAFLEAYQSLLDQGYEIISMHISEGISGTINSARQAKAMISDTAPITIHDSSVTAMVLKMQILEVLEAIQNGATLAQCQQAAEHARACCGVYFTVNTLDYLERGGRLSRMQAFAGNLLQLRPILTFKDGKITSIEKVRTYKGAVKALKERFLADLKGKQVRNLVGTYTDNQEFVEQIVSELCEELGIQRPPKSFVNPLTPVIGTHTGPGTIGLAYLTK